LPGDLEASLRSQDFEGARRSLLHLEAERRRKGYGRKCLSYYVYLCLIAFGSNQVTRGYRLLRKIRDPLLKHRIYELKADLFGLCPSEEEELRYLKQVLGISQIRVGDELDPSRIEIGGRSLGSVRDESVKALILLFLRENRSLTKEEILKGVWNL